MRDFLRQFLLYSRSERRAVVALIVLIVIVLIAPRFYRFYIVKPNIAFADSTQPKGITEGKDKAVDSNTSDTKDSNTNNNGLFYFDPNTISTGDWLRLGLTEKQAGSIEKYRSKGGKFKTPDDLRRIYVLSDQMKDRLVPYVRIKGRENMEGPYRIEINTADSAAFEALYSIGPTLSARIIKYRKALGGFYRIEQVAETRGLSDSTYQGIKVHLTVNPALVKKIDINAADYQTLQKHPYIHAKIAHAIIGYRNENGKFESLDQLRRLKPMTNDIFEKLSQYLKL